MRRLSRCRAGLSRRRSLPTHARFGETRRSAALLLFVLFATPVHAQAPARFTVDSVLSVDSFNGENVNGHPQIIVDISAVLRVSDNWQIYIRPWLRLPRPPAPTPAVPDPEYADWDKELYQAAVRYQRPGRIMARVDAGYIASPIGLGVFDMRASINPTIAPHFNYILAMPPIDDPRPPRLQPLAGTYPLGTMLTLSTDQWDGRIALVNSTPTRNFAIGGRPNPRATPVLEAGGGVTPTTGLRFGGSLARGAYATRDEFLTSSPSGRMLTLVGVEGEYAFGYTKVSGELVRDHFAAPSGGRIAYAWFVQGIQTLSPHWFVAARQEGTSAPPLGTRTAFRPRTQFKTFETTAGFRWTPEITLRSSYFTRRPYLASGWDHQVGVSVVWEHRWW